MLKVLEAGIDVHVTHPLTGHSLLYHACVTDHVEMIEFLILAGADPNHRIRYQSPVDGRVESNRVALMYARSSDAVRLLIKKGADVNAADDVGLTSLMLAAFWGKRDVVVALLEAGADATLATNNGRTACDMAADRIADFEAMSGDVDPSQNAVRIEKMRSIHALLKAACER